MNEPVIFTDIYPYWQVAWYTTPSGQKAIISMILIAVLIGGIVWWYLWKRRAPYRAINHLIREIERDSRRAPDACIEAFAIIALIQGKELPADRSEKILITLVYPEAQHSCIESLITARYGALSAPIEVRTEWIALIRTALSLSHNR